MPNIRKVALVTGGAKRVGRTTCHKLHSDGYNIAIHYNSSKKEADELLDKLNKIRPSSAFLIQGDLTENVVPTCERIVKEAVGAWGRLDLLVNNAAYHYVFSQLGIVKEVDWDNVMNTNLKAPIFLMQLCLPHLKATKGNIINMGDILGIRGSPMHFAHCLTRTAMHYATATCILTIGNEVRVNCVAPGLVLKGDNASKEKDAVYNKLISETPLGYGEPQDIAEAISFLASDKAKFITGQRLTVDGGRMNRV